MDSSGCNGTDVCVSGRAGSDWDGDIIEGLSVLWVDDNDSDAGVDDCVCGRKTLNIHFCGTLISSLCGRPSWKFPFEPRAYRVVVLRGIGKGVGRESDILVCES